MLLVRLTHVPGRNDAHSAVQDCSVAVWLCSHSCCTTAQLCWLGRWQSPTAVPSPGDKLQELYSGFLQRRVAEINYVSLSCIKLSSNYCRCVLMLHIFVLHWWGFICDESNCCSVVSCAIIALWADKIHLHLGSTLLISHAGAQDTVLALGLSRVAGFLLNNPMSDTFLVCWDRMAKTPSDCSETSPSNTISSLYSNLGTS